MISLFSQPYSGVALPVTLNLDSTLRLNQTLSSLLFPLCVLLISPSSFGIFPLPPPFIRVFVFIASLPICFGVFFNAGPPIAIPIPIFTFVFTLSYSPCPRFPFAFCMHCTLLAMHCLPPLTPCLPLVSLSWFQPSSLSFILLYSLSCLALPSPQDEPSSGMDPRTKRHLWKIISEEVRGKCAVVLTSHRLEENSFSLDLTDKHLTHTLLCISIINKRTWLITVLTWPFNFLCLSPAWRSVRHCAAVLPSWLKDSSVASAPCSTLRTGKWPLLILQCSHYCSPPSPNLLPPQPPILPPLLSSFVQLNPQFYL